MFVKKIYKKKIKKIQIYKIIKKTYSNKIP